MMSSSRAFTCCGSGCGTSDLAVSGKTTSRPSPDAGMMNIMDVEIRHPSPADGERLGAMHYASWQEAYASFLPPEFWGEAAEQRRITNWIAALRSPAPGSTTWIALRDGEILGFVTV